MNKFMIVMRNQQDKTIPSAYQLILISDSPIQCTHKGFTALHLAIVKYRNECARLLISELGARSVCAVNDSGITAAHVASSAG